MAQTCVFCGKKLGMMGMSKPVAGNSKALMCSKCQVAYQVPLFKSVESDDEGRIQAVMEEIRRELKNQSLELDEAMDEIVKEASSYWGEQRWKKGRSQIRQARKQMEEGDIIKAFERIREFPVTTEDLACKYKIVAPIIFNTTNRGVFASVYNKLEQQYSCMPHKILLVKPEMESPAGSNLGILALSLMDASLQFEGSVGQRSFDQVFYIGLAEMKLRAAEMGANAIIGLRIDFDLDTTNYGAFYLQMYGTAVTMEE